MVIEKSLHISSGRKHSSWSLFSFQIIGKKIIKFEPVDSLEPGEKLVYKIICQALEEGSAKNTAVMLWQEFERAVIDEEGTSLHK